MDINLLILFFLIIFMLHNLEEVMTVERWMNKTYPVIRERIPSFAQRQINQFRTMTAARFAMVVFLLSIPASAVLFIAAITEQYFLFLSLNIIFALNIFTHPLQSLFLRCYVPGLWTALFLIIPYNIFVFYQLYNQGILKTAVNLNTLVVIILFIPVFILCHKLAERWI